MKVSNYNVLVAMDEDTVLYNTLYGSVTRITAADLPGVRRALAHPEGASEGVLATLLTQRHFVSADTDEYEIVLRRRQAGVRSRGRLDVIVMPTLECNFECVYCYEQRVAGRMSPEVEERLVRWFKREMPTAGLTLLHWFGGEPLLDVDLMVRLTRHCQQIAAAANVRFWAHVTTNGSLLAGARLERLLDADIVEYQITLDGPAATHDVLRPMAGGRPSFDRVQQNIVGALVRDERVVVTLRVNVNHENIAEVPALLTQFPESIRGRLRLAIEPIFGNECVSATANLSPENLSVAMGWLYDTARDLGYEVSAVETRLLTGRKTYCYAEREREFVFGPTGAVFKCAAGSFARQDRLADLAEDGTVLDYEGRWAHWMSFGDRFSPRCHDCVYLPICMGGCRQSQAVDGVETCTLVPFNSKYVLKQIALTGQVDRAMPAFLQLKEVNHADRG
jgi:uncharacterized protein